MLANLVKNPISVVKKVFFIFSKFSLFLWCRPFLFKQVCHVTPLKLAKLQKHNNAYRGFNLLLQVIQSATKSCNLMHNHAVMQEYDQGRRKNGHHEKGNVSNGWNLPFTRSLWWNCKECNACNLINRDK